MLLYSVFGQSKSILLASFALTGGCLPQLCGPLGLNRTRFPTTRGLPTTFLWPNLLELPTTVCGRLSCLPHSHGRLWFGCLPSHGGRAYWVCLPQLMAGLAANTFLTNNRLPNIFLWPALLGLPTTLCGRPSCDYRSLKTSVFPWSSLFCLIFLFLSNY